jgi:hypothetical protein
LRQHSESSEFTKHTPHDSDIPRIKNNFRQHAAELKLYLNAMTAEQLFQFNASNKRTLCGLDGPWVRKEKGKTKKQSKRQSPRSRQWINKFSEISSPASTVRDLCDNIKASSDALEAAALGWPEEQEQGDRDSEKLGIFNAIKTSFKIGATESHAIEEERFNLQQAAATSKMDSEDVNLIKSVFDSYDLLPGGGLDPYDLESIVSTLLRMQLRDKVVPESRVQKLCDQYWSVWHPEDKDETEISFDDFLAWYSYTLRANTFVTENERLHRIAADWNMQHGVVEHLKRCFDAHHESGCIDAEAFSSVLHKALRVPPHLELPPRRVAQFFHTCDDNASGLVAFEEFLSWWAKYFHSVDHHDDDMARLPFEDTKARLPFEDFYRRIRCVSTMTPDPPAYFGGVLMSELLQEIEDLSHSRSDLGSRRHSKELSRELRRRGSGETTGSFSRQVSGDFMDSHRSIRGGLFRQESEKAASARASLDFDADQDSWRRLRSILTGSSL